MAVRPSRSSRLSSTRMSEIGAGVSIEFVGFIGWLGVMPERGQQKVELLPAGTCFKTALIGCSSKGTEQVA